MDFLSSTGTLQPFLQSGADSAVWGPQANEAVGPLQSFINCLVKFHSRRQNKNNSKSSVASIRKKKKNSQNNFARSLRVENRGVHERK